jgi:hypothetical protein
MHSYVPRYIWMHHMVATRDFWWTVTPTREVAWTRRQLSAVLEFYAAHPNLLSWDVASGALGQTHLQMRLRVRGRDRHAAGQWAQDVASAAIIRAKATGIPFSVPLPPHRNRGKRKLIGAARVAAEADSMPSSAA